MKLTKEMRMVNFLDMGIKTTTQEPAYVSREIEEAAENDPAIITTINKMLGLSEETGVPIYVLTTKSMHEGAKAILYPGVINRLAESFEGDFWMLPSSIHEVLIIPGGDFSRRLGNG